MNRLILVAITVITLGCSTFGLGDDPFQAFYVAKAAYVSSFEGAVRYVQWCQSQLPEPTVDCDKFTVKLATIDETARTNIGLGELLVQGVTTPEIHCDEITNPGCTEAARIRQIQLLGVALQQLATQLGTIRK